MPVSKFIWEEMILFIKFIKTKLWGHVEVL
jgi:hypothetical protein